MITCETFEFKGASSTVTVLPGIGELRFEKDLDAEYKSVSRMRDARLNGSNSATCLATSAHQFVKTAVFTSLRLAKFEFYRIGVIMVLS